MASQANTTRDPALSKFIEALLVPMPPESVVDTAYNLQLRRKRWAGWRQAFRQYEMWASLSKAALALELSGGTDDPALRSLPTREKCRDQCRIAYATLLNTPAHDRASLAWKKRQKVGTYSGGDAETLRQSIKEDEAFLDAHPVTRVPRRPRSKRA